MDNKGYELLAGQPFLSGLPPRQLEKLSVWARTVMFEPGARLFEEDGHADRFWFISEGQVNLDTQLPGPGNVIMETLGPGAVLGWSWLYPPYRWHFGASAQERTVAVEVDAAGVRELCENDPQLGFELVKRFMTVVAERLQHTRLRLLDLYQDAS